MARRRKAKGRRAASQCGCRSHHGWVQRVESASRRIRPSSSAEMRISPGPGPPPPPRPRPSPSRYSETWPPPGKEG
eukprot:scaffold5281_cov23-Phaeocystis_antarctica.AAC.1